MKATAVLVPLFGIQLFFIIYRPPFGSPGWRQYEIFCSFITQSQVSTFVTFLSNLLHQTLHVICFKGWAVLFTNNCCNCTFIALNLHRTTDSKALHPFQVQCCCLLSFCLIALVGNQSTRSKPTMMRSSSSNLHISVKIHCWNSSVHYRYWE